MLFSEIGPSRDQIYNMLALALSGERTRVYVDASLLIHCYEMSPAARDELVGALEELGPKVTVPIWAARETWEFMKGRITKKPLDAQAKRVIKELDKFRTDALRYVDDDTISELTKEEFQGQLDLAESKYRSLMDRVANFQPKTDITTSMLAPFIEDRRLKSHLSPIIERVSQIGPFRAAHNIPPGFSDVSPAAIENDQAEDSAPVPKGKGKVKNPFGDLIFWFEALADCQSEQAEHLVILTRDVTKGDWVYSPIKLRAESGSGLQENNGTVTLPSPLLVTEATSECPHLQQLHVVSLEMFANVLQRTLRIQVPNLAAAIQANSDRLNVRAPGAESRALPPVTTEQTEVVTFESSDMSYELQEGDPVDDLVKVLLTETWDGQNQAAQLLESYLPNGTRDHLVQIGRALVSASNQGAVIPTDVLSSALGDDKGQYRASLLIGALAAVYIEDNGEPKKPTATSAITALLYQYETDNSLAQAYHAVLKRLAAQKNAYLALPGDHTPSIPLTITTEGQVLRSVTAFDTALFEEDAPSARRFRRSSPGAKVTVGELIAEIAREFVVPAALLQTDMLSDSVLQIPESLGFVAWGPNTGLYLR